MAKKKQLDLVQIIRDNPGCYAQIDNDCWFLYRADPADNPHDWDDEQEEYEAWETANALVDSDDNFASLGEGYGSGNCYGGDILQALARIVGIKVESV